jgi:hypothetical protein
VRMALTWLLQELGVKSIFSKTSGFITSIFKIITESFFLNQLNNVLQFMLDSNKVSASMTGKNIFMDIYTNFSIFMTWIVH